MSVLVIRKQATKEEIQEMLKFLETYIKVAVDICRKVLAGGGVMHADCEALLIEEGSRQEDIWGANWDPKLKSLEFEALINIRPRANNRTMAIQNSNIKAQVEEIVRALMEEKKS